MEDSTNNNNKRQWKTFTSVRNPAVPCLVSCNDVRNDILEEQKVGKRGIE